MLSIYVEGFEIFLIPTQCSSETWLLASFSPQKQRVGKALTTGELEVLPWKFFSPLAQSEDPVGKPFSSSEVSASF